ncbi:hypothetical protein [Paraburkholderia silvatlantica]|uniref:hypothetical protein n=1 Tax=Paraburkholderia silvatlantica TaxID=321895 RepID=UPI0010609DB2|nr:hypothetical protein [Paraburkholderia silvatlantica]TDQ93243.1 hypothetical protein C7412_109226 [Paraburkholderia silvatlantica]
MGFVIQRFHQLIRPGVYLGAARSKHAVHSQQSRLDSACVMHCLLMVLQIAGVIDDASSITTRRRRIEAMLWRKTTEIFLKGMTFSELATFITDLDCEAHTELLERGSHRNAVKFIEHELSRERLVICSWREVGTLHNHAVLAIGASGIECNQRFTPGALLLLDPAEGPPTAMGTCNAQLDYASWESGELRRYARYTTASETLSVVLNGAISIEVGQPKRPP